MRFDHPILIAIFGLPGTGKTTLAKLLSQHLGIDHFNTDTIRNMMDKRGQYDERDKGPVYDEMLHLTRSEIKKGKDIIVDGTFYKRKLRTQLIALAQEHGAVHKWIEVCAKEETVKKRVSKKRRYSEADHDAYQKVKAGFEPMEEEYLQLFSDRGETREMLEKAIEYIKQ